MRRLSIGRRTIHSAATLAVVVLAAMGLWASASSFDVADKADRLADAQRQIVSLHDSVGTLRAQALASAEAQVLAPRADSAPDMIMPVVGMITSRFSRSRFHPLLKIFRPHKGVYLAAPSGTPIHAPADASVKAVGWRLGYGLTIELTHSGGVTTLYGHCKSANVKAGQEVHAGQTIGAVGSSGIATGSHVHFEVHLHGTAIDPLRYLAGSHGTVPAIAERLVGEGR
jgi:murein DD-endopeptidase MepM/ murein hydrolase activator NlpD